MVRPTRQQFRRRFPKFGGDPVSSEIDSIFLLAPFSKRSTFGRVAKDRKGSSQMSRRYSTKAKAQNMAAEPDLADKSDMKPQSATKRKTTPTQAVSTPSKAPAPIAPNLSAKKSEPQTPSKSAKKQSQSETLLSREAARNEAKGEEAKNKPDESEDQQCKNCMRAEAKNMLLCDSCDNGALLPSRGKHKTMRESCIERERMLFFRACVFYL